MILSGSMWRLWAVAFWGLLVLAFPVVARKEQESAFSKSQQQANAHAKWRQRQEQKQRAKLALDPSSPTQIGHKNLMQLNENLGAEQDFYASSSLPPPHEFLSYWNVPEAAPKGLTADERVGKGCSFIGAQCPMEIVEHRLAAQYIKQDDAVLEVGGRFGTTSCEISVRQKNSGRLVVVEPDNSVWHILSHNQHSHNCGFWILRGAVSNHPYSLNPHSYGTRTNDLTGALTGAHISFQNLQNLTMQFTALLIDCEGCIDNLFLESGQKTVNMDTLQTSLSSVRTIILEADMGRQATDCHHSCVDYEAWLDRFRLLGFRKVHQEVDPKFWFIAHYVLQRP